MSAPVRITADVDLPDRLIGPLTARQVAILAATGLILYTGWTLTRAVVPMPVFLALALPLAVCAAVVALGQRDGIPLDRLLLAAIQQRVAGRHRFAAPENAHPAPAWLRATATGHDPTAPGSAVREPATRLRLPAQAVTNTGVIDLGRDGLALVAVASTVNFALRTRPSRRPWSPASRTTCTPLPLPSRSSSAPTASISRPRSASCASTPKRWRIPRCTPPRSSTRSF